MLTPHKMFKYKNQRCNKTPPSNLSQGFSSLLYESSTKMEACRVMFSCRCRSYSERWCFLFLASLKLSNQDWLTALQQTTCKCRWGHAWYCHGAKDAGNRSGNNTSLISALCFRASGCLWSLEFWCESGSTVILPFRKTRVEEQQMSASTCVSLLSCADCVW